MNNLTKILFITTLSVFFLIGNKSVYSSENSENVVASEELKYKNPDIPIEERLEDLLFRMTNNEKIEQLSGGPLLYLVPGLNPNTPEAGTPEMAINFDTPDNERLGIPGLKFTDGPRGVRWSHATCFAVPMSRGASWDLDMEEKIGYAMGLETEAKGRNVLLAPCINVVRHPGWGRAQETYSEDPYLIGRMGVSFINGAQRTVMANAKHYAVNNIENTRQYVNAIVDERTLREVYLPQFKMSVKEANVASIMSAYNRVNGIYASENKHLLNDILRNDWGFKGFVVSDWFAFKILPLRALTAGLDVEMPHGISYGPPLKIADRLNILSDKSLDEAVKNILRQKFRFGLFDKKIVADESIVESKRHTNLALESGKKGIVLLKNKDSILPLDKNSVSTIAVVGDFADVARLGDEGSSAVIPSYAITPFEGIKKVAGDSVKVIYADNHNASAAAAKADVTIVITALTAQDEGEYLFISGGDRTSLGLPDKQVELINKVSKVNDRCIVVMEAGSTIIVDPWADNVEGLIMAWYPGMEGGYAIADVIFGNYNPGGKLPLTFAKSNDQYPKLGSHMLRTNVKYDYYHGYKHFDKNNLEPRYEFGYGLSYTKFEYSNLIIDKKTVSYGDTINISLDITNVGDVSGDEVVQLYVGFENSKIDRPVKGLKGFAKISLDPGETKEVNIVLDTDDLAYYNEQMSKWEIENMPYNLYLAASSRDIRLKEMFEVIK